MVFLDTRNRMVEHLADSSLASQVSFLIAYSGFSRNLLQTGFNHRVRECQLAAQALGELSGDETARILSDIPVEVYERFKASLPVDLNKRAQHFFSEVERVRRGRNAWLQGDFELFGKLMNQSCESSIQNYQSGSEALIELSHIVQAAPGVLGARFSGGGYGGCVVGLVEKEMANRAIRKIAELYSSKFPSTPDPPMFVFSRAEKGVRVL
jgi:galactokinase